MIYAIKTIDGKEVNKKISNWDTCKSLVIGHEAVYKTFRDNEENEADQYLITESADKVRGNQRIIPGIQSIKRNCFLSAFFWYFTKIWNETVSAI